MGHLSFSFLESRFSILLDLLLVADYLSCEIQYAVSLPSCFVASRASILLLPHASLPDIIWICNNRGILNIKFIIVECEELNTIFLLQVYKKWSQQQLYIYSAALLQKKLLINTSASFIRWFCFCFFAWDGFLSHQRT